jgi:hypothetical protein
MSRKSLAVLVSGAYLLMTIAGAASAAPEAAIPTQPPAQTAAPAMNQPPLPPGGAANIREAQSRIGPGIILLGVAAAAAVLVVIFLSIDEDEDDTSPSTGT